MQATTIHFVRHGEVHNPDHILYERLPGFHLSDRGRRMAEATARYLAASPQTNTAAAIYSSPLDRTRETAQAILTALNETRMARNEEPLELVTDQRIIEAGNNFRGTRIGHGEGALWRNGNWKLVTNLWKPSWGESYRQIAALRGRFADIHIDAVYSSDLFRTMTTAKAVYLSHGLELHTDPGLREISLGAWEDKPWGELERCDAMNLIRFNHSSPDFRVEGGETFAQVQARLKGTVLRLAAAHPGQTSALFSHGTAIRCLQGALRGLGPGEMDGLGHSDNTAVTCLEVEGDTARIVFENDNSHLPDEISTLARQRWWKERDGTSGDANLWFRPLNLKKEGTVYRTARHEAWQDVNGPAVPFDGDAFQRDALRCWKRAPERAVMCAMQRDETAGLLQMDLDRGAAEGVGYIPFLYMDPAHRRQGLGVQLLGQAVSTYRPLGRDRLRLCCAPDNGIAQRFYQKYGFVKMGEEPGARGPLDVLEKYIGFEAKES